MGVFHSPDSAHSKELAKWEQQPTGSVPNPLGWADGGRYPRRYEVYPKMVYKAGRPTEGNVCIVDDRIVTSEAEERLAQGQGYYDGQEAAIQAIHDQDQALARAAAERAYRDQRMSPDAQAEALAWDQSTSTHLGEIPETPIKKRGRPAKVIA